MKRLTLLLVSLIIASNMNSQCLSGNCENGFGKIQYSDGTVYEGEFYNKEPHGLGITTYKDGNYYFGNFKNSKFSYHGFLQNPNGQNFIGYWENGSQNGQGIFMDAKGNPTAGVWEKGVFKTAINSDKNPKNPAGCEGNCADGYGRLMDGKNMVQAIFKNGEATYGRIFNRAEYTYDGQIENGFPNGYGQMNYTNGEHYFGYFKNGLKNGKGILSNGSNPRVYGTWDNDIYMPFDMGQFCSEMSRLVEYFPSEFLNMEFYDGTIFEKVVDRKFLGLYDVSISSRTDKHLFTPYYFSYVDFSVKNATHDNLSLQQIKNAFESCKKFIKLNDSTFTYQIDDGKKHSIKIYKYNSTYKIEIQH